MISILKNKIMYFNYLLIYEFTLTIKIILTKILFFYLKKHCIVNQLEIIKINNSIMLLMFVMTI